METFNIWHYIHLHRYKIALFVAMLCLGLPDAEAQMNYQQFQRKRLYFGISLAYNTSDFKIVHDQSFIYNDSIMAITSGRGPGFNLGIISNLRLSRYFDVRFIPALSFADKKLNFTHPQDSMATRTIESILLNFPVSIRFLSQPYKDIRVYVLAGLKYDIDLASNAKARRAEDQIKLLRHDVGYEYGIGLQFFFPLFIFSPEIKVSHGIYNVHARDRELIYSRMVDKLLSRMFIISFHFEG